ncbi:MAG: hypothetical protein LBH90_06160 [Tannerella sp.]|nr:hypothetical protein [Tannerella sp.]
MRKHFTTLQGFKLKKGALKGYSGQGAVRPASCPAQGIEAESPTAAPSGGCARMCCREYCLLPF